MVGKWTTTGTLFITEEGAKTLKHKLSPHGHYMTRIKLGTPMKRILEAAALGIGKWDTKFIVIDTLSFWLNLKPKAEDDSVTMNKGH